MNIVKTRDADNLIVALEGRLDTVTAPELEMVLSELLTGVTCLTINMEKLDYVSSAGLRVILKAQKIMFTQGSMKITNVNESIMEVFEITGFSDILNIE